MATAEDRLKVNIHLVRERANRIMELVDEYNLIDQPDYGDVGDLAHVNAELMELIQFLEGEE